MGKIHNIPFVAFNREGVSHIASVLGVPKRMDSCTSATCNKLWGRPGFAKVLVEVWAVGDLKRELEVIIPSLSDGSDEKVKVHVEYIREPHQCYHCCLFGHKSSSCVKAESTCQLLVKDKRSRVDADGFTRVEKRQWKKKGNSQPSTSGTKPMDPTN
ncbi:uncharacterized protein LOC112524987 [Cynara cardunculus var. scolymus]|uniref:uncharacterized protein LOC112524987 n=1 Tax=Cynara cardunculus var. scolymus TaxID=59895 RepID=UPI000D62337B|nr:uncharacterized protein LOC112524987 [Cynara cardunculus var. scolymus]